MSDFRQIVWESARSAWKAKQTPALGHLYLYSLDRLTNISGAEKARQDISEILASDKHFAFQAPSKFFYRPDDAVASFAKHTIGNATRVVASDVLQWLLTTRDFEDEYSQRKCRELCNGVDRNALAEPGNACTLDFLERVDEQWIVLNEQAVMHSRGSDDDEPSRLSDLEEHAAALGWSIKSRRHYLLVGPRKCGKTLFVRKLLAHCSQQWRQLGDNTLQSVEFAFIPKFAISDDNAFDALRELRSHLAERPTVVPVFDGFELYLNSRTRLANSFSDAFATDLAGEGRPFLLVCDSSRTHDSMLSGFLRSELRELGNAEVRPIAVDGIQREISQSGFDLTVTPSVDRLVDRMLELAKEHYSSRTLLDVCLELVRGVVSRAAARAFKLSLSDAEVDTEIELDDLEITVAQQQGLSPEIIGRDPQAVYGELAEKIKRSVIGQEHAVDYLRDALIDTALYGVEGEPRCRCLFAGPPGVGKTYLAKKLAEALGYGRKAVFRYNMSDFSNEGDVWRFIGSPQGYEGRGVPTIFDDVVSQPSCVILLDEIDRAHRKIQDVLLSMLEGEAKNGDNQMVSFANAIFIMTTNLGQELVEDVYSLGKERNLAREDIQRDYELLLQEVLKIDAEETGPGGEFFRKLILSGASSSMEAEMLRTLDTEIAVVSNGDSSLEAVQRYIALSELRNSLQRVQRSELDRAFFDRIDTVVPFFPIKEEGLVANILELKLQECGWKDCTAEQRQRILQAALASENSVRPLARLIKSERRSPLGID